MITPALLGVVASSRQADPFFSDVILLLTGYGTDGGTNIVDASSYANTITRNDASFSSAQSKFGSTSMLIDASSSANRINVADSSLFDFGTGDFTVEGWFYPSDTTPGTAFTFQWNAGATGTYMRGVAPGPQVQYFHNGGGNSSGNVTALSWTHWAVCKSSGVVRFFQGGIQIASLASAVAVNMSGDFIIGNGSSSNSRWEGYIEQFRVTKGVARYPSAFTPPTEPFPTF